MAAPNPEEELARLRQLAKKGLPPLVVLTGAEAFFRGEALAAVLAAVPPDAELITIEGLDVRGGGSSAEDADDHDDGPADADAAAGSRPELQNLRGGGLFARQVVVCVRRGDKWLSRHAAAVLAVLPKITPGSSLVVEAQKVDRRTKAGKQLQEAGALFEFRELYDSPWNRADSPLGAELVKWVVARSRALSVPVTPEAAWLIVSQVGKAPADLMAELERVRDQLGVTLPKAALQPEDLRGKLSCTFESTPFELADAILDQDQQKAWRSVRAMADRGVRKKDGGTMDQGGVFPFATSWLYQSLATLYEARQVFDAGAPLRDLPARFGIYRFQDTFTARVQKLSPARLRRGILALLYVQRLLRSAGEDPDALLERFLSLWFGDAAIPTAEELEW